jgi:hypothetical protein
MVDIWTAAHLIQQVRRFAGTTVEQRINHRHFSMGASFGYSIEVAGPGKKRDDSFHRNASRRLATLWSLLDRFALVFSYLTILGGAIRGGTDDS